MNILVISGGSGNDALIKGLKSIYPESNVNVLVNAYDNGKSTGVCRAVTSTLGVSDIRKNHIRMYKAINDEVNQCFVEFYDARYDFTKGNEVSEISEKLDAWNLSHLRMYVERFFNRPEAAQYTYNDFNVSNIVYAQMYSEIGYEATNKFFTAMLNLKDFVILNSFDNIFIRAVTESGKVIEDEGDLVEYCNPDDLIVAMDYRLEGNNYGLNPRAISAIRHADLIVISTGTFWSSIYPTLDYLDLYKYVNEAKCKKIWAINCEQDKDTYGVGSNQLIQFFNDLGLDLSQFTILENMDAHESLRQPNSEFNVVYRSMDNNHGKHNGWKYARELLKLYYGISTSISDYDKIIFDFDDTLWSRDSDFNSNLENISRSNVELVSKLDRACIVSGNSFSSISKKIATVYGTDLSNVNLEIWADANSSLFQHGCRKYVLDSLLIKGNIDGLINHLKCTYDIFCTKNDDKFVTCLKIKPLSSLDQALLSNYLNDYLLKYYNLDNCKAVITGTTTVDIVAEDNNKLAVLNALDVDYQKVLYIGDELDHGNDYEISSACGTSIHTSGVKETAVILKLLLGI